MISSFYNTINEKVPVEFKASQKFKLLRKIKLTQTYIKQTIIRSTVDRKG